MASVNVCAIMADDATKKSRIDNLKFFIFIFILNRIVISSLSKEIFLLVYNYFDKYKDSSATVGMTLNIFI
ncbi:MAG: hypothetical protein A3F72_02025 [Bacteroidetes bacterium RIFCSPLOWO2_12_FULL_35_15]|nr:MAG: hypothetical protein A3F72_02025 [Bacteroidetes bacterium RIFCSPLOWO2_12_FULL_35_15]